MDSPSGKPTAAGFASFQHQALAFLDDWEQAGRRRQLISLGDAPPGRLDLTHNDYLGLRSDAAFQAQALAAAAGWPVGAGASRLLGGEHAVFRALERQFAQFKRAPDALFFGSGYAANEACVASLARFGARIFSDSLNHASIIDGVRLSGGASGERVIFPHGDLEALERGLANSPADHNLILCESLFSMDGDRANLERLAELAKSYRGLLMIDEAHAIGALGPNGRGLVPAAGLDPETTITVNTCGKALGVQGALVCGPSWFRELLINTARPFIFSTGPSPWCAAALQVAIDYVATLDPRRAWLEAASLELIAVLGKLGFDTGTSSSFIIPILCGSDRRALALAERLNQAGLWTRAIRPPTVPEGMARVRISLHAGLNDADLARIIAAFEEVARAT